MKKPTLAIVFHRFGPYHKARIESLRDNFNVIAIELSSTTKEYAWDPIKIDGSCNRVTICDEFDSRSISSRKLYKIINAKLDKFSIDAIAINGWSDNGAIATLNWCLHNKTPTILMSESNEMDFKRNALREWPKKQLIGCFDSSLVGGSLARDYMMKLGMSPERIFLGYDIIDNDHFSPEPSTDSRILRRQLNLPRKYFLTSNRFITKKNLNRLLDAYALYREKALAQKPPSSEIFDLVLIGDGPLRETLYKQVQALRIGDYVHFLGFLQYQQLPIVYWGADAFVHSSTSEQWGLVINEAMAAGLPVIASNRCGATADLIEHQKTGLVFDPFDTKELSTYLYLVSSNDRLRSKLSDEAKTRICNWGKERFASGMYDAFRSATSNHYKSNFSNIVTAKLACQFT